jgi:nucleotide-binding universal stress UspA family protein
MTRFLVGCDGSAGAAEAMRWAVATADVVGAEICAVRSWVYPPGAALPSGPSSLPDPASVDAAVAAELDQWIHDTVGASAVRITARVERGPGAAALLRLALELSVDVVVVGAEGADTSSRLVLGSVTERCLEESVVPVVVVPDHDVDRFAPPSRIMVGYDGSDPARRAVDWAAAFGSRTSAEVVVVMAEGFHMSADGPGEVVSTPPPEAVDELEAALEPLREAKVDHRARLEPGDAREAIPRIAEEERASLVVVGSRGLGRLPRLLLGSVARYVVSRADRPVVVVPDPERARLLEHG